MGREGGREARRGGDSGGVSGVDNGGGGEGSYWLVLPVCVCVCVSESRVGHWMHLSHIGASFYMSFTDRGVYCCLETQVSQV